MKQKIKIFTSSNIDTLQADVNNFIAELNKQGIYYTNIKFQTFHFPSVVNEISYSILLEYISK